MGNVSFGGLGFYCIHSSSETVGEYIYLSPLFAFFKENVFCL